MRYESVDPTTEEVVKVFEPHDDLLAEGALEQAVVCFAGWRRSTHADRARRLGRMADLLESRSAEYADLMAREMGKPLAEGVAEARKCAAACRWFAVQGEALLRSEQRPTDGSRSEVRFEPLGPLLAIMPWNFPFWQFFRFAAPALAAGNVILLKHAPNTPRCALAIERLVLEAGFPEGVVQNLFLSNEQVGRIIADDRLRGVTLTGSTRAGKQVAQAAGRSVKPVVLELGGSDPFILLDDAELAPALEAAVAARCQNSGQSCIAAKRFLVHRSLHEAFLSGLAAGMSALAMGDPTDPGVRIGPLARRDLRDRLASQVEATLEAGARALCGGSAPQRKGWFYPPTVLRDAPEGSPALEEELFGPVAVVIPFDSDEEAVRIANATRYGLGASLWTGDEARALRLTPDIEAGSVFVNGIVRSDPRLPFGGVKESGFGRELSREGILEFVNVKTVWVR